MGVRDVFLGLLSGEVRSNIEAESRKWFYVCKCGNRKSVWDAGGIRFHAASSGKVHLAKCSQCGHITWMKVVKLD